MPNKHIRFMAVAAVPEGKAVVQSLLGELKDRFLADAIDLEICGVAYNRKAAIQTLKQANPDFLFIDLMLPTMRSIEVISLATALNPEIKVLALTPGDPPHERVIMAIQAGALGFVTKDMEPEEVYEAAKTVLRGDRYLPLEETFDVLQQTAPELIIATKEKRAQFVQALLATIPAVGIVAAFTEYLWRSYWGQIGVRVADLGVDASSRVTEFLVTLLVLLGIFGPLMFIPTWLRLIKIWIEDHPRIRDAIANTRRKTFGKILLNSWTAWFAIALGVLLITIPMEISGGTILTLFLGVVTGLVLLLNFVAMDDVMPEFLKLSKVRQRQAIAIVGAATLLVMISLSVEVFLRGPDLRPDGLHGIIAPKVLGLTARPVVLYDLDQKHKPVQALYLGGNADLYVLYDPYKKTVRFIPVGSSRVEFVKELPRSRKKD